MVLDMDPNFNVLLGDKTDKGTCEAASETEGKKEGGVGTKVWVVVVPVVVGVVAIAGLAVAFLPKYDKKKKKKQ